jgi:hypothetical protein
MARVEDHIEDCERLLGKPYEHVHLFLDQYAQIFLIQKFGDYHRSFLHNSYGLVVVEAKWGTDARKAATIHIIRDYAEMPVKGPEMIDQYLNRAMIYFNNLTNFDLKLPPHRVRGWAGKSLVSVAMGK